MMDLSALYQAVGRPAPDTEPKPTQAPAAAPDKPERLDLATEAPAPAMDPEELAELERVNADIRETLAAAPGGPPGLPEGAPPADDMPEPAGWLEARRERAAILETEGGLTREAAEAEAARLHPEPEPQAGAYDAERLHGFTRPALLKLADPTERPDLEADPDALEAFAFAFALRLRETRERGERPAHYTREALCEHCGPVFLFPGDATRVRGCPWCEITAKGRPIPRPLVACADCRHWRPDTINPPGGLGSCEIQAPASKRPGSCWPRGEIYCGAWRPREGGPHG